jgi:lipopolysaccharide export system permease protein
MFSGLPPVADLARDGVPSEPAVAVPTPVIAVLGLRMMGLVCSVMAAKSELAVPFQYLMLAIAIGTSLWIIVRGIVIEPPARLLEALNKLNARLLRLLRGPATA